MFSWFKKKDDWQSPVGDPDKLDIISKRANGRVDLLLVMAGALDGSPRTLDVIARKFRNYCDFVRSADFRSEFGEPTKNRVTIGLNPTHEVPDDIMERLEQIFADEDPPAQLAVFYEYPSEEDDPRPTP